MSSNLDDRRSIVKPDVGLRSTHVGERANPHPSRQPGYVVEVIDESAGEVCVRYVGEPRPAPWWITKAAWRDWVRLTDA